MLDERGRLRLASSAAEAMYAELSNLSSVGDVRSTLKRLERLGGEGPGAGEGEAIESVMGVSSSRCRRGGELRVSMAFPPGGKF